MNEYRIFFIDSKGDYLSALLDDFDTIDQALDYFINDWSYSEVLGIMKL